MFGFTAREKAEVAANCDRLTRLKYSPSLPYASIEHGALMPASVLNSPTAFLVRIQVMRAFTRLPGMLAGNKDLALKVDELVNRCGAPFRGVLDAIRRPMRSVPPPPRRRIGFAGPASGH
jgi:hypothetical protein